MEPAKTSSIALFGAAEKGNLSTLYYCENLYELFSYLGQPQQESEGIFHAIQAICYGFPVLYVRVLDEGIRESDYRLGLKFLHSLPSPIKLGALYLPGVGFPGVIEEGMNICRIHRGLLIIKEADFYDYICA
jgi:hypothetical protein